MLLGDIVSIQNSCSPIRQTVCVGLELLSARAAGPQGSKVKAFLEIDGRCDAASASNSFHSFLTLNSDQRDAAPSHPPLPVLVCV